MPGATLLKIGTGGGAKVRRLTPQEIWRAQGGEVDTWQQFVEQGHSEEMLLKEAVRALPAQSARALRPAWVSSEVGLA